MPRFMFVTSPSLAVLLGCAATACSMQVAAETVIAPDTVVVPATHDSQRSGYRAYLDPATGQLSSEPPPAGTALPLSDSDLYQFTSSDVNLIPVTGPDGSMNMDLQGRYRQGSAAFINERGQVEIYRFGGEIFASPDGVSLQDEVVENQSTGVDTP